LYDPPEAKSGRISTAGDIWGLGITLVEALTQTPPAWSRERSESVSLPANLASEFVDTVQRCLNRDAGQRPAIGELVAQFTQAPQATPPSAAPPLANESLARALSRLNSPKTRFLISAIAVGIITLGAVWTGVHLSHTHVNVPQTASITPESPRAVSPPAAAENPKASIAASVPMVLHQELPDVSRSARQSIRGVIKIAVRVIADGSGNVVTATLDDRASSKYFARAAMDAAKKWKFAQAAGQPSRVWLLHFEFTRAGTAAHADVLR
jgi:serine/threonine protein kinase